MCQVGCRALRLGAPSRCFRVGPASELTIGLRRWSPLMWVGIVQSMEGLKGTKRQREGGFALSPPDGKAGTLVFSWPQTKIYILNSPGPQVLRLRLNYTTCSLDLQLTDADCGTSQPPSLREPISRMYFALYIYVYTPFLYIYFLVAMIFWRTNISSTVHVLIRSLKGSTQPGTLNCNCNLSCFRSFNSIHSNCLNAQGEKQCFLPEQFRQGQSGHGS